LMMMMMMMMMIMMSSDREWDYFTLSDAAGLGERC